MYLPTKICLMQIYAFWLKTEHNIANHGNGSWNSGPSPWTRNKKNAQKTVGRTSKAVASFRTACWQIDHKNKDHVLKQNKEDYIEIIHT